MLNVVYYVLVCISIFICRILCHAQNLLTCMYVCMYLFPCAEFTNMYVCMYVCMYVPVPCAEFTNMYVCMYVPVPCAEFSNYVSYIIYYFCLLFFNFPRKSKNLRGMRLRVFRAMWYVRAIPVYHGRCVYNNVYIYILLYIGKMFSRFIQIHVWMCMYVSGFGGHSESGRILMYHTYVYRYESRNFWEIKHRSGNICAAIPIFHIHTYIHTYMRYHIHTYIHIPVLVTYKRGRILFKAPVSYWTNWVWFQSVPSEISESESRTHLWHMHECMHVSDYYMHAYIHTYIHVHALDHCIHAWVHACMHTFTHTFWVLIHTNTHIPVQTYIHVHTYIHFSRVASLWCCMVYCMYVCMYVCNDKISCWAIFDKFCFYFPSINLV